MINRESALLIVIDIQGNLFQAMQDKEDLLANAVKMIKGAKVLDLPILATEQMPEKLGTMIEPVRCELGGVEPIGKESFSSWQNNHFREKLGKFGRREAIIIGIECHVCVYQTAIDLIENGYRVHVVSDAVSSRTIENRRTGLSAMKSAGAKLTSTEMILFELLRSADDAHFKEIHKIVK
jgi:nicotinamidase-related amidase